MFNPFPKVKTNSNVSIESSMLTLSYPLSPILIINAPSIPSQDMTIKNLFHSTPCKIKKIITQYLLGFREVHAIMALYQHILTQENKDIELIKQTNILMENVVCVYSNKDEFIAPKYPFPREHFATYGLNNVNFSKIKKNSEKLSISYSLTPDFNRKSYLQYLFREAIFFRAIGGIIAEINFYRDYCPNSDDICYALECADPSITNHDQINSYNFDYKTFSFFPWKRAHPKFKTPPNNMFFYVIDKIVNINKNFIFDSKICSLAWKLKNSEAVIDLCSRGSFPDFALITPDLLRSHIQNYPSPDFLKKMLSSLYRYKKNNTYKILRSIVSAANILKNPTIFSDLHESPYKLPIPKNYYELKDQNIKNLTSEQQKERFLRAIKKNDINKINEYLKSVRPDNYCIQYAFDQGKRTIATMLIYSNKNQTSCRDVSITTTERMFLSSHERNNMILNEQMVESQFQREFFNAIKNQDYRMIEIVINRASVENRPINPDWFTYLLETSSPTFIRKLENLQKQKKIFHSGHLDDLLASFYPNSIDKIKALINIGVTPNSRSLEIAIKMQNQEIVDLYQIAGAKMDQACRDRAEFIKEMNSKNKALVEHKNENQSKANQKFLQDWIYKSENLSPEDKSQYDEVYHSEPNLYSSNPQNIRIKTHGQFDKVQTNHFPKVSTMANLHYPAEAFSQKTFSNEETFVDINDNYYGGHGGDASAEFYVGSELQDLPNIFGSEYEQPY